MYSNIVPVHDSSTRAVVCHGVRASQPEPALLRDVSIRDREERSHAGL